MAKFYESAFGWQVQPMGEQSGNYSRCGLKPAAAAIVRGDESETRIERAVIVRTTPGAGCPNGKMLSLDRAGGNVMGANENMVMSHLEADGDRIVDAALALGEQRTWNAVHMYDIADHMGIPLAQIERHFGNKDEISDAWFRRADNAIAACADAPGWMSLTVRERISRAIRAWFGVLEPHKGVAVEMLRYKVQPDHMHLVVKGVIRTSATVQWVREAARVPSTGLKRELEEPVLTAVFLGALGSWLTERAPGTPRTWKWMEGQLAFADRVAQKWPSGTR